MTTYRSVNPTTEAVLAEVEAVETDAALDTARAARAAQIAWGRTPLAARVSAVRRLGAVLGEARDELARTMALEIGKPLPQAAAEVDKCVLLCEGYASVAAEVLADRQGLADTRGVVEVRPIGTVLGVMPWNFPIWQTLRFVVPNLLLGNTCLIKPAPNAALTAGVLADVVARAGLAAGVCEQVLADEATVSALIADDAVAGVSVTGSVAAGAAIAAQAGRAVKKVVLELGGSDPFIVLPGADLDRAVAGAVRSRLGNTGQSCVAAKRFIVDRTLHDEFVDRFAAAMSDEVVGDPSDEHTTVGPLARADLRDQLADQVARSVTAGATVAWAHPGNPATGFFHAPTLLTEVPLDAPVWVEETFGPLAPVVAVDGAEAAVVVANDSDFGLGASVWGGSAEEVEAVAERLEVGMVFQNDLVASDWRLPFGGTRRSGHGRELAAEGFSEFANLRTRWRH